MSRDQLGHQRQAEAGAADLGGHERLEQALADMLGHARAVVGHPHLQRRAAQRLPLGRAHLHAVPVGGADGDLAASVSPRVGGLGGVLHQVEEHLYQLVLVAHQERQRGIVAVLHGQAVGDAVGDQGADAVEDLVDVQRSQAGQGVLRERLHPVDQPAHAVGLVDDQLGERRVLGLGAGLQKLGGAANAGQRVLDLVRQHASKAHDRAQAARDLRAGPLGAQAGLHGECQQHRAVAQRRGGPVRLERRQAEEADLDSPFTDPRAFLQRPVQQRDHRRAVRQGGAEAAAGQQAQALAEQRLGRLVRRHQGAVGVDHQGGIGTELEGGGLQGVGGEAPVLGLGLARRHAANLCSGGFQRADRPSSTDRASSRRHRAARASRRASGSAGQCHPDRSHPRYWCWAAASIAQSTRGRTR